MPSNRRLWEDYLRTRGVDPGEQWPRPSPDEKRIKAEVAPAVAAQIRGTAARQRGAKAEAMVKAAIPRWADEDLILYRCGPPSAPIGAGKARVAPGDYGPADLLGRLGSVVVAIGGQTRNCRSTRPIVCV